jgi:hypothetical protein
MREFDSKGQTIDFAEVSVGVSRLEAQWTRWKYRSIALLVFPPPQNVIGSHADVIRPFQSFSNVKCEFAVVLIESNLIALVRPDNLSTVIGFLRACDQCSVQRKSPPGLGAWS